jgi:hypothetical protein
VSALSVGVAAAASQGSSTSGFGTDTKVIGSCGSGIAFADTTTYDSGIAGYAVNGINLSNIPAGCLHKSLSVTFYNDSKTPVGSTVTTSLPSTGTTESIPVTPSTNTIETSLVTGISVVVS